MSSFFFISFDSLADNFLVFLIGFFDAAGFLFSLAFGLVISGFFSTGFDWIWAAAGFAGWIAAGAGGGVVG